MTMRFDLALVTRGLCDTRSRAKMCICEGHAAINGIVCTKPAQPIAESDVLEITEALPFVGRGGQLLDKFLAAVDLDRKKNIYIANMVKCRPPQNRDPSPEEQNECIGWLREQTRLLRPKIIVCLGRISATRLISPDFKVTKQHGQFFDKNGTLMMGTFHPAALLRNPNQKPEALEDFIALREKILEVCPETYEL